MNPLADIVKKGLLKFKIAKSRGSSGCGVDGPKGFKEFWFVFRALQHGEKLLEYYQNERKYHEKGPSKGRIPLREAAFVQKCDLEKKQQFCIEFPEQTVAFFEAVSIDEADDWMQCLNAVLFGKGQLGDGILQYHVELYENEALHYSGPCILEVKGGEVTVWNRDTWEEVVRWKLAHIRSFKAKKHMLTIYPGSRSSTGRGEFYFKSTQSVQITHAIETIVQKVKAEGDRRSLTVPTGRQLPTSTSAPNLSRSRATAGSERRPLPALPLVSRPLPRTSMHPARSTSSTPSTPGSQNLSPPPVDLASIPNHIVPEHWDFSRSRKLSSNAVSNIPEYRAPEYEELDTVQEAAANALGPIPPPPQLSRQVISDPSIEEYGQLQHAHTTTRPISSHEPTNQQLSTPAQSQNYSLLERHPQSSSRTSPKPSRGRRRDYEDIPDGPMEGYGKLDRGTLANTGVSLVDGDYDLLDNKLPSPVLAIKKPPPPKPAPYKPKLSQISVSANAIEEVYSEIDQAKPVNIQVSELEGYNKLERKGVDTSGMGRPKVPVPTPEGYGKLNRRGSSSNPELALSGEHYGALKHFPQRKTSVEGTPPPYYNPEEYGKLEHGRAGFDPYASLSLSESYREGPRGLPVATNPGPSRRRQNGTADDEEPQFTSEEFYGQLAAQEGRVEESDYSTVDLRSRMPNGNLPATASNGKRSPGKLSPQSSLPKSEEVCDDALNPPRGKVSAFESLYEPSANDVPLPPVPPRRGISIRLSPKAERKNGMTVTPPNGSPQAPHTSKPPIVPPKPKPKPKPKPRPDVHV